MRNLFFDIIGHSPKKYLIAYKINMLRNAIQTDSNNLTISDLMKTHNLDFQSQVNKDFKDFFDCTPFKYKKNLLVSSLLGSFQFSLVIVLYIVLLLMNLLYYI